MDRPLHTAFHLYSKIQGKHQGKIVDPYRHHNTESCLKGIKSGIYCSQHRESKVGSSKPLNMNEFLGKILCYVLWKYQYCIHYIDHILDQNK
jgi:hypothetical protein